MIDSMKNVAYGTEVADVMHMVFNCGECHNEVDWTPFVGASCPYCGSDLFTEDGEILGF
jgi:rRNA maturation endonuclease Nob1